MNPRFRTLLRPSLLALFALLIGGCGGSTPSDPEENGLRPGSYMIAMEIFQQIGSEEQVLGRHRIVFRVSAPGTSSEDFRVTSAERIPESGPIERDYIQIDPDRTEVTPEQWIIRMRSDDGTYEVRFSVRNAGSGDFQIISGCSLRQNESLVFQGSGCILDRV